MMISIHEDVLSVGKAWRYAWGFRAADVPTMERLANCLKTYTWSHCIWRDGRRRQTNFVRADLLGLDFDCSMPLSQAMNVFCDSAHVIGLTRNHGIEKAGVTGDRFRVVLKLERPITDLPTIRATSCFYIKRWGADGQCVDGARLFFPCREIVSVNDDGEAWEVIEPEPEPEHGQRSPRPVAEGELSAFALYFLRTELPAGTRNTSCHRFAKDLLRAGFDSGQILDMIRSSPTYKGRSMPPDLIDEVTRAIRSAHRAIAEENQHGA